MFCPTEYTPFSVLFGRATNDHFEEAEKYVAGRFGNPAGLAAFRAEDKLFFWIMDLVKDHLYATNGFQSPMRIDPNIFRYNTFFVDISLGWMSGNDAKIQLSKEVMRKWNFCDPISLETVEDFNQIVESIGEADDEKEIQFLDDKCNTIMKDLAHQAGQTRPPIFLRSEVGVIDLELFDSITASIAKDYDKIFGQDVRDIAEIIRKLNGYFLCVPDVYLEREWNNHWKDICTKKTTELEALLGDQDPSSGRPRKRDEAAHEFMQLFPQGREGMTWKQAVNELQSQAGIYVSADTLKRGLGKK